MDDGVDDILETCLAKLAAGASVDECLATYPAQRGALEAPLRAAAGLMRLPRPAMPSHARAALEGQMLAHAARRRAAPSPRQPWWRLGPSAILAGALRALGYGGPLSAPWLRIAAVAVALVLVLLFGAGAYAAARAVVSVFAPAPTPAPTAMPTVMPTATPAPQSFAIEGVVERIDQEAWVVDGTAIAIDTQTTIDGTPAVGAIAHVSGVVRADGARLARTVRLEPAPTLPPPAPTVAPTPFVFPTITPSPAPAPIVAPPGNPGDNGDGGNGSGDNGQGKDKQCQGQQKGRDDKKCDPKPKDNGKKDDGKKKDDGGKPKKKD
jgi:hypothetical protein